MSHFVTALFEDHAKASAALQALIEMGVAQNHIVAIGLNDGTDVSSISGFRTLSARDDVGAALDDLHLPAGDRAVFERGLLGGYALVGGRIDPENLDQAIDVLDMFEPLDLDRDARARADDREGGQAPDLGGPLGAGVTGGGTTEGLTNTSALPGMGSMVDSTDELGTADLRTGDADQGPGSTLTTGQRREDARAGREGVTELSHGSPAPAARSGPLQRNTNRGGRVWAFDFGES
jgi:hypothetical protein